MGYNAHHIVCSNHSVDVKIWFIWLKCQTVKHNVTSIPQLLLTECTTGGVHCVHLVRSSALWLLFLSSSIKLSTTTLKFLTWCNYCARSFLAVVKMKLILGVLFCSFCVDIFIQKWTGSCKVSLPLALVSCYQWCKHKHMQTEEI